MLKRYEGYAKGEDFIRKYIFPGGHLPTVSKLVDSIEKGSKGTLVIDSIENIGGHYAKTLSLWSQKFMRNFDDRIKPALLEEHKDMSEKDVELFKRKWEVFLLSYSPGQSVLLTRIHSTISLIVKLATVRRLWGI